jgi:hypothetical protein
MHVSQPVRNVNQLNRTSIRFLWGGYRGATYKLGAVRMFVLPHEFDDVSIFHPFRNHRKPVFTYCHAEQWQDVWMPEVFPGDPLSAESLQRVHSQRCDDKGRRLTLRMTSKSLVKYTRTTLIATRRPLYVLCDTSANPPRSTSTESSEQSGMCIDFGITRCRPHVLQSLLSNFSRSGSGIALSSRRCDSR